MSQGFNCEVMMNRKLTGHSKVTKDVGQVPVISSSNPTAVDWIRMQTSSGHKNVYAPTTDHDDAEVETFYEELDKTLQQLKSTNIKIIMGDFNAKVGARRIGNTVGSHGLGEINERGEMLVGWCQENDLVVANTCTIRRRQMKFTGQIYRARGIEHLAMTGKINGKKSRGRQRTTYVDSLNTWASLEQHTRSQFMRSSCERQIWKTMTVNACSRHGT
ncbi:craniofacial development protein 2-like [Elysia marginata]|uniref:Craniofacial development protein 2-like n=1 Tax=Elysia marginata TaxID=1093978 RepID=A0AAV4J2N1_9GAST|nr:craniofacial development protein 2-like [Elysia marginata]